MDEPAEMDNDDEARTVDAFASCDLYFGFSAETRDMLGLDDADFGPLDVKDALARMPTWVLPRGPVQAAAALRLRQEQAHELADEDESESEDNTG